jgi:hypothetical protein
MTMTTLATALTDCATGLSLLARYGHDALTRCIPMPCLSKVAFRVS